MEGDYTKALILGDTALLVEQNKDFISRLMSYMTIKNVKFKKNIVHQ